MSLALGVALVLGFFLVRTEAPVVMYSRPSGANARREAAPPLPSHAGSAMKMSRTSVSPAPSQRPRASAVLISVSPAGLL